MKRLEVKDLIERESGYTVRLLNKEAQKSAQVIFGLLLFDGKTYSWVIRFVTRKKNFIFADSRENFKKAKQLLVEKVQNYLDTGYKVTKVTTGYEVTKW